MPWIAVKKGNSYVVIKKSTGEVVSHHDTKEKAEASIRARYASESKD